MVPVYEAADIIVIPFAYDFGNMDATRRFAKVLNGMSKAQMFFVPNRINLNEEKSAKIEEDRMAAHKILDMYGKMTPRIKQSIVADETTLAHQRVLWHFRKCGEDPNLCCYYYILSCCYC